MLAHFLNEDDVDYKKNKFYNDDETLNEIKLFDCLE